MKILNYYIKTCKNYTISRNFEDRKFFCGLFRQYEKKGKGSKNLVNEDVKFLFESVAPFFHNL